MEAFMMERRTIRTLFTKTIQRFEKFLKEKKKDDAQVCLESIQNYHLSLEKLNDSVVQSLLASSIEERELEKEMETAQKYKEQFYKCKVLMSQEYKLSENVTQSSHHNLHLPKIELYKFDGNMLNWIKFWNTFKKIHDNESISNEDKFYYLIQSIEKDTRAAKVLDSFPPSAENYCGAIESLKSRFGDKDLLIELYIRELLKLVLSSMNKIRKSDVVTLYDQLESHLRALESLEITTEACAPLLYPLVESSLPEDLLRTWQRHAVASSPRNRLEGLITFLQGEVQNEQRIAMAKGGFDLVSPVKNAPLQPFRKIEFSKPSPPTAASLVSGKITCLFCKNDHDSEKCIKARKMSTEEREKIVHELRLCLRCLKPWNRFHRCKLEKKCNDCGKFHLTVMCRGSSSSMTAADVSTSQEIVQSVANISINKAVHLQTLKIKLINGQKTKVVRLIIDSGCQYSYIRKDVAKEMSYISNGEIKIQHGLFGGSSTSPEIHNKYTIFVQSLTSPYRCQLEVFDKDTICPYIPCITDNALIQKLRNMNAELTDIGENCENISVLIGSDMLARLFSPKMIEINSNVIAIENKLGWSVIGRSGDSSSVRRDVTLHFVSLLVSESSISHLWRLDTLGIRDPTESQSFESELQQFMWWDVDNPKELQFYRHCRVVFGLTCSPFLLGATLDLHLENMAKTAVTLEQRCIIIMTEQYAVILW